MGGKIWWSLRKKGTKDVWVLHEDGAPILRDSKKEVLCDAEWAECARPRKQWSIEPIRVRLAVVK